MSLLLASSDAPLPPVQQLIIAGPCRPLAESTLQSVPQGNADSNWEDEADDGLWRELDYALDDEEPDPEYGDFWSEHDRIAEEEW